LVSLQKPPIEVFREASPTMARWDDGGWDVADGGGGDPWASWNGANATQGGWGGDAWDGGRHHPSGQRGRGHDWRGGGGGGSSWNSWEADTWAGGVSDPWVVDGGTAAGKDTPDQWACAAQGADDTKGDSATGSGSSGGVTSGNAGNSWAEWDSSDPSSWAPKLNRCINWNGLQLVALDKNFYEEHADVANRTEEEVEEIRRRYDIEVLAGEGSDGSSIPKPVTTFEEAGMPDWLLQGVLNKGFKAPTPIQIQVWPVALQGRDLIGIAETGSGKTLAYLLPMMIHIMAQEELKASEGPVGVVLCPTRELALQINDVAQEYIGPSGLRSTCIYGGGLVRQQGSALKEKNDIVVATPGRFIQLLNEGWTNLNRVTYVVLDEADEMLSAGFGEQIRLILTQVRPDRQMLMFSATWPKEVQKMAREHCTASDGMEPVIVRVGGDRLAACRTIMQKILVLGVGVDKFQKLCEAIMRSECDKRGSPHKCLIFCRTKASVDTVVQRLNEAHIEAFGLHADKQQDERIRVLNDFRNGELSCLASTNCLGRGHDIPRVRYVINYDAPDNIESYIHRIGRTGRAGEQGYAMTFLTEKDARLAGPLIQVLKETHQNIPDKLEELWQWSYPDPNDVSAEGLERSDPIGIDTSNGLA